MRKNDNQVNFHKITIKKDAGPKGFDPLTTGLEVQHSIHAELQAQELGTGLPY